ncbi:MAG: FHA domain-containing protein [Vicinamibacteria bacterium]
MRPRVRWRSVVLGLLLCAAALPASSQEPPAIVALTLDTSGSIRPALLEQTRALAVSILEALPPGSEVALFTFDDASRVILERTNDPEAVRQALAGVNRAGRYTALYDALYDASRYLQQAPRARKAIVLVTDGKDENSALQAEDGLRVAVEAKIPVYAIGIGQIQETVLRRVAKLTSGEYAPMGEFTGSQIAERIAALQPSPELAAAPTPAPVAVTPDADEAAVAVEPSGPPIRLILGIGLIVIALGAATFILMRLRTPPPIPLPPAAARGGLGRPLSGPLEDGTLEPSAPLDDSERAESTVVMRSSDVGAVEKTMLLRMKPVLRVIAGPSEGETYALGADSALSIGRGPTNDITLADSSVSGEHCRIRPESGLFVVHDLQSTNGTWVNDMRIQRQPLREGDVLRIGETKLKYTLE